MDVSGRIPVIWMPAIHAGLTQPTTYILGGRETDHESLRGEMSVSICVLWCATCRSRRRFQLVKTRHVVVHHLLLGARRKILPVPHSFNRMRPIAIPVRIVG